MSRSFGHCSFTRAVGGSATRADGHVGYRAAFDLGLDLDMSFNLRRIFAESKLSTRLRREDSIECLSQQDYLNEESRCFIGILL